MSDEMTKNKLIATLRSKRAEWDATLAEVPENLMTESGVAGEWSVKDIIAHLAYFERWYAERIHEQLRGEQYAPTELDQMSYDQQFDQLNKAVFELNRDRSLQDVL